MLALRCLHQCRCPCNKWNYLHARRFSTHQKPTKFFNFIKPKYTDKTPSPEKSSTSPSSPFSKEKDIPFSSKPFSTSLNKPNSSSSRPSTERNSTKQIIPKTIDGTIIENKFTKKTEVWPYREATEGAAISFSELGLHEDICKALAEKQIVTPTPVQTSILYNMLLGEQMLVRSQTGTGKTIAMVAGLLQQVRSFCTEEERKGTSKKDDKKKEMIETKGNTKEERGRGKEEVKEVKKKGMKVLVMAPTRELAWQITKWIIELEKIEGSHKHFVQLCTAGVEIPSIISNLRKYNPPIVVGTPKQLIQILHEAPDALNFSDLRTLVVDEVDHIVQAIGIYSSLRQKENKRNHPRPGVALIKEIKSLFSTHPHQMIVMSATLNSPTKREIWKYQWMTHPVLVNYGTVSLPSTISHHLVFTGDIGQTEEQLIDMVNKEVQKNPNFRALVFIDPMASVKDQAERLTTLGINSVDLSTALSFQNPAETKKTFENFLKGQDVRLFVTTEFTARGFDLPNMDTVFILGCFFKVQSYIHMAGRTGRMGNKGQVITIMPPEKLFKIYSIFRFLDIEFPANLKEEIERAQAEADAEEELEKEREEIEKEGKEENEEDEEGDDNFSKKTEKEKEKEKEKEEKRSKVGNEKAKQVHRPHFNRKQNFVRKKQKG